MLSMQNVYLKYKPLLKQKLCLPHTWWKLVNNYLATHEDISSFWLNLHILIKNQEREPPPMNFWNVFQNLINLLIGRIYPLFSDNIFSFRLFLNLFASSSEIFLFGHYGTKLSSYFVFRAILLLQNIKIKRTSVYFQ